MTLSNDERKHLENIVEANKWFTFKEAEKEIRSHWNSEDNKKGNYLSIQRRQLQKIIRSDIIGSYLQINNRKYNPAPDDVWFKESIYGWIKEEILPNGEKKLHVFPKYDDLFEKNEQSIVLSALDDELGNNEKSNMRDIYEKMHGNKPGKGKTKYLMTEPYLFALKHEVERRKYPTKTVYLSPHTPKEIISKFKQGNFIVYISKTIDCLINYFTSKINNEITLLQEAKNAELQRYENIFQFLKFWDQMIDFKNLKKCNTFLELSEKKKELSKLIQFKIDRKHKLKEKYSSNKLLKLSDRELKIRIEHSIYSFESYNLSKLEQLVVKENTLLSQASLTRHEFYKVLYQYLKKKDADDIIFDALENEGK